jgi:integrase
MRERSPGHWELRVHVGRDRYVTRSVTGTRKEAQAALIALQHEVNTGKHVAPSAGTVAQFLSDWWEISQSGLSPSTRVTTEGILRRHLIPGLGKERLSALSAWQIDRFYAGLRRKGLAPATIHRIHGVLRRALETARKSWGLIPSNPAADANPGPLPRRAIHPIEPPLLGALMRFAQDDAARAFRVMASTGMRPGELCGLQRRDLDLTKGTMHIRRRIVRGKVLEVIDMTKSGRARLISLGDVTCRVLAEQLAYMADRAQWVHAVVAPEAFVFSEDELGRVPWHPQMISKRFSRAAKQAGIQARLYDLRHSHVTNLVGAGVDLTTISRRVGHARVSTTVDYYSGVVPGADAKAAQEADDLFHGQ